MKTILAALTLVFSITALGSVCKKGQEHLYLNMPLVLGDKIFNDQVEICSDGKKFYGELTVPKRFKAALKNISLSKDKLSFSITADEGSGPFTVDYVGDLKEGSKFFLGLAKIKGKVLGPFVGISSKKKSDYKIIQ